MPLTHHAEIAVVQAHDLDRRVVLQAGRQLLNTHLHRAFARDAKHLCLGLGHFNAHRIWNTHAHGAQATGVDPAIGLIKAIKLGSPHLVLTHIRSNVSFDVFGHVPQRLNHHLRFDHVCGSTVILEAIFAAPSVDRAPPVGKISRRHALRHFFDLIDHLGEHVFYVAHDRDIHLHALGNARRIDIDMNDLALVLCEMLWVADHAVIKSRTHRQQHIAVLHRVVGFHRAVHTQHAEEFFVRCRVGAQTHERVGHWIAEHVDQGAQLVACTAQNHATAGVDVGTLGCQQQLQSLANLSAMAFDLGLVAAQLDRLLVSGRIKSHFIETHVFWNIHHHWARAAGARDMEGLLDRISQIASVLDEKIVLDDWTRDAHRIALLEGV